MIDVSELIGMPLFGLYTAALRVFAELDLRLFDEQPQVVVDAHVRLYEWLAEYEANNKYLIPPRQDALWLSGFAAIEQALEALTYEPK